MGWKVRYVTFQAVYLYQALLQSWPNGVLLLQPWVDCPHSGHRGWYWCQISLGGRRDGEESWYSQEVAEFVGSTRGLCLRYKWHSWRGDFSLGFWSQETKLFSLGVWWAQEDADSGGDRSRRDLYGIPEQLECWVNCELEEALCTRSCGGHNVTA